MKRYLTGLLTLAVIAYVAIAGYMFVAQRSLQYEPDPARVAPASVGLPSLREETLQTPDGEKLVVWSVAAQDPAKPTYLYLHGNAQNLAAHNKRFAGLIADGSGLYAMSWRGYSGSTGSPTEAGLRIDARAAYDMLATRVAPDHIIIIGESLGTTLAVMLAAEVQAAGLVIDAGFTSAVDVGAARYPWLPVPFLMKDQYRADLAAPNVDEEVLQLHCRDDRTIPLRFGDALNALFRHAEPIIHLDGACHPVGTPELMPYLTDFSTRMLAGAK